MNIVIVTNIPSPYRVNVFNEIKKFNFTVIYCAKNESNRNWNLQNLNHNHIFLKENSKKLSDGFNYIHNNPDVLSVLKKINPQVVLTTGFNPTHLYSFVWAVFNRASHVCMSDGSKYSEGLLSWRHKMIRKLIFSRSKSFIAASHSGIENYLAYGIDRSKIFQSHLCANNTIFNNYDSKNNRIYDVMFSGQFHERKLPFLFVEICTRLKIQRGYCRALLIGDGPLRIEILKSLKDAGIDFHYAGFVQQNELPKYYASAKLLIFTTRMDPWGVVANEAMASGTPVVTTPYAGVAGELVIDGVTGAVRVPDAEIMTEAIIQLLDNQLFWSYCSTNARKLVENYTYNAAARGIEAACISAQNQE